MLIISNKFNFFFIVNQFIFIYKINKIWQFAHFINILQNLNNLYLRCPQPRFNNYRKIKNFSKNSIFYFSKFKRFFWYKPFLSKLIFKPSPLFFHFNLSKIINKSNNRRFVFYESKKAFFYNNYYFILQHNWAFLTTQHLSSYYWDFFQNKKWLKKNIQLSTLLNFSNFKLENNLNARKFLINNYFYLNKTKLNLYELKYLIKLQNTFINVKNELITHSNPYLFINNQDDFKFNPPSTTHFYIYNYFKFTKTGPFKKKVNSRLKNEHDLISKPLLKFSIYGVFKNYLESIKNRNFFIKYNNIFIPKQQLKVANYYIISAIRFFKYKKLIKNKTFFKNTYLFIKNKFWKLNKNKFFKNFINFKNYQLIKIYNYFNEFNKIFYNFQWLSVSFDKLNLLKLSSFFFTRINIFILNYKPYLFNNNLDLNLDYLITNQNFSESIIFMNYKPLILFTKEKNNFVLSKSSFILLSDIFFNEKIFTKTNLTVKKNFFSFSYKNELNKFILKRYMKTNTLYLNISDKIFNNSITDSLINYSSELNLNYSSFNLLNLNHKTHTNFSSLDFFAFSNKTVNDFFELDTHVVNYNIKRIKFKPGYMILWRNARTALKLSMNLSIRYQYRLSNFLINFNKFIKFKTFLFNEFKIKLILYKSKLLPDYSSLDIFFENGLVFLNGHVCFDKNYQTAVGDFIQLIISLKYYILHKWLINWNLKKKTRLKNLAYKKLLTTADFEEKQRSHKLPNWIIQSKKSFFDMPKYIEVDYFSLSLIILYEPFFWNDIDIYSILDFKFNIINMYNWKYIT